jgi:hypothetical protein
VAGAVGGIRSEDIRNRALAYWSNIDAEIGKRI